MMTVLLERYDRARQALAECRRVDEAKKIRDVAEAQKAYARQAKDRQMEIDAIEIRERAETRLGELLREQKALPKELGGGLNRGTAGRLPGRGNSTAVPVGNRRGIDSTPKLEELGIDKKLSFRAQKKAEAKERDPVAFEQKIQDWRASELAKPVGRVSKIDVHLSSESPDWGTPQELFGLLNSEFRFRLDVCAAKWNAKCERFYSIKDNGLKQDWRGRCWMNPPYGDQITAWVAKAYESREKATVVCLLPARVDTGWWWDYVIKGEIRFLKGRLKFERQRQDSTSAPFPSAIVVFGPNIRARVRWWDWRT